MSSQPSDPGRLRRRLDALETRRAAGRLDGLGREALSEACFRLALHEETPPREAVVLLRRAVRLDGSNPKHAYHLGRLLFTHGALDDAGAWLGAAHKLTPTSHRVLAHVSQLLLELNQRHRGDEKFEPDALRRRAQALVEAVDKGEDAVDVSLLDLKPPPSKQEKERRGEKAQDAPPGEAKPPAPPAARLSGAGRCRWSGVLELAAEELLAGSPSEARLPELQRLLARVAEAVPHRSGGAAALATLGVQWLVVGYPPGPVARVLPALPASPARVLLQEMLDLHGATDAALPERLARSVSSGSVPPIVAAALHQRRLLWQSLRFPTLAAAGRAARALLRESPERTGPEATERLRALQRAARELDPTPPAAVAEPRESEQESLASEDLPGLFRLLETSAGGLESEQSTLFAWVREDLVARAAQPAPDARAQLRGDHEAVQRVLAAFEAAADRGTSRLEQIREALRAAGRTDLIEAFPARGEKAKAQLDGLRNTGRFRKQLRRVEPALDPSVPGAAPSALLQDALAHVDAAFAAPGGPSPSPPSLHASAEAEAGSAPPTRASAAALEGATDLERALAEIDGRIDAVFEAALAGFDAYPLALLRSGPLHELRLSVLDRKAEALFRLGRRREARSAWVALLRAEPLSTAALRNVAVCETGAADRGGERSAWRAYAELLYVEAAAGDRPGRGAAERAALHRDYGGAMAAPDVLRDSRSKEGDDVDVGELAAFLGDARRVRSFVDHTLLAWLNLSLEPTHPSLALGVHRDATEQALDEALAGREALRREVVALLPEGAARPFSGLLRRHYSGAREACRKAGRLTLRKHPGYADEEARLVKLLAAVIKVKYRLVELVHDQHGLRPPLLDLPSYEGVAELRRLDHFPLGAEKLAQAAAGPLGLSAKAPLQRLAQVVCHHFVEALLDREGDAALRSLLVTRDPDLDGIRYLLGAFVERAQKHKGPDGHERVSTIVRHWLAAAAAQSVDAEHISQVARDHEQALINAFLSATPGIQGEETDWAAVGAAMGKLLAAYPDTGAALHLEMVASFNEGNALATKGRREEGIRALRRAREAARRFQERAPGHPRVEEAADMIKKVDEAGI